MLAPDLSTELARFAIGFDHRDRALLHQLWDRVLDSERWSEGELTAEFEREWSTWNRLEAVAFNGWTGAALAALEWAGVRGETVLCPSNTFMATPLAAISAGANVEFVDCNRDDLCMSFEDLERKVREHKPRAVFLVHIGGHLAFESDQIAELCRSEGIVLLEDCAHAHGAEWNGRRAGSWGDAGIWSFAPTKTISTGEGGMLVSAQSRGDRVRARVSQLRQARLRGARPELPPERVHRRDRARADDTARRDHRVEERRGADAPRPALRLTAAAARRA